MTEIRKVGVIGAGVMGAGIAAHVANSGVPVVLLDIVADGKDDRSAIAKGAVARLQKTDPAPLMHPKIAAGITPGNTEDDGGLLADCDWIVEAVLEDLEVKHGVYRMIEANRRPRSIVSSNTSTIPLATLVGGLPRDFARDFLITHFFNPPRYLRLLELVVGTATRPAAVEAVRAFCDRSLGKGVVEAKDTPGFIANRIGVFWLQCAVVEAMAAGLTVEEADAVMGRPIGAPGTGVFGLLDLIGLDLMPRVLESMKTALPEDDPLCAIAEVPPLLKRMIEDGYTGRKGKGGFYRLDTSSGERIKQAVDLASGDYRTAARPKLKSVAAARKRGLRALVTHADKSGRYAWRVLAQTLAYAASLVPEIADDVVAVDEAMRLGYNWKAGPFELIDQLGPAWFAERLRADGRAGPALLQTAGERSFYRVEDGRLQYLATDGSYRDVRRTDGVLLLSDVKRRSTPLARNRSASLWDIGDGVACLEFHSRMNALDFWSLSMVQRAVRIVGDGYRALVIHNEGTNFSVGANIGLLLLAAPIRLWFVIDYMVRKGQQALAALRTAPFPVAGAPSGMALGGGLEVLLHCDAVQAHAETYAGLVETGVGLVPGWGGSRELLWRWAKSADQPGGPMPPVIKVFETVSVATVAKSAVEARDYLFLRPEDRITMNRDRLLADAKARALELAEGYEPPVDAPITLPGPTGRVALELAVDGFRKLGKATAHDVVVAGALAEVVSGGATDITETVAAGDVLDLERRQFMRLVREPATLARIRHMLKTGKPLRN